MPNVIGIIDTGVMCCWLEIPEYETAGSAQDRWDNARANREIDAITSEGGTIILPNSVVIETCRIISQRGRSRRTKAAQILDRTLASLNGTVPWARFAEHDRLWTKSWYETARDEWLDYADRRISLTDYSLLTIARFYRDLGEKVRLLSTDGALRLEVEAIPEPEVRQQRPRR